MTRSLLTLCLLVLFLLTAFAPSRTAPAATPWETTPDASLKKLGRITVKFPAGTEDNLAQVRIYQPGAKASDDFHYGNAQFDVMPGQYDVGISERRIAAVPAAAGQVTRLRAGALHAQAGPKTRIQLYDANKKAIVWAYGEHTFGLAEGTYYVRVKNGWKQIQIRDGETAEL